MQEPPAPQPLKASHVPKFVHALNAQAPFVHLPVGHYKASDICRAILAERGESYMEETLAAVLGIGFQIYAFVATGSLGGISTFAVARFFRSGGECNCCFVCRDCPAVEFRTVHAS